MTTNTGSGLKEDSGTTDSVLSKSLSSPIWLAIAQSPIGKKILTGLTGLGLVTFILVHMLGNLVFFLSKDAYNQYAYKLEQLSPLVWAIEALLLIGIVVHSGLGIQIYLSKRRARTTQYNAYKSAGYPSHQTLSSRTMIGTGGLIALFIVWHLVTFKFGPHYPIAIANEGIMTSTGPTRDLARLVTEIFQQSLYTLIYTVCLVLLGIHLRHGIWSAFQSLGLLNTTSSPIMSKISIGGAIAISLGFLAIPWSIYLGWIG